MSVEQIQQQVLQTYNQNLEFFKNHYPDLYKNLELYAAALNMGQVKPNFDLQYVNGYFDIVDLKNKQFLYGKNSLEISKQVIEKNLDFEVDTTSFKTFYEHFYNDARAKEALDSDMLVPYTLGTAPVINYVNKNLPKPQMIERIEKLIIFGVALGLHIPLLHEKLKSKVYLIVEPNLEFFRLSMFTVNYAQIGKASRLFFSVAENQEQFRETFDKYYGEIFIYNHCLKFLKFSDSANPYIQVIQNFLVSQPHYLYSYERTFLSISRTNSYIAQQFKFLNIAQKKLLEPFTKPVLYLAAGPSLQRNIEFVRNNQDKFIIVAIYATLPILERNGVKPDIVTQYDEQDKQVLNTLDKLTDISFFNDSLFIFSSHVNAKLMNSFPKENIFVFQAMFELKQNFGMITSPSIGELTYGLLMLLDAREVYLLGLDLALDVETGETHIEGHSGSSSFNQLKDYEDSSDQNYSYRKNTIKVKGNFLKEVETVPVFKSNIDNFAMFTQMYKSTQNNIYNLSNGAHLAGTKPLQIKDINLDSLKSNQKDILRATVYKALESISEVGYNKNDIDKINLKLSSAKKIKKSIDAFKKIKKFKDIEDYKNSLINLIQYSMFEKHHCEDLQQILINYGKHVFHQIFHLLNLDDGVDKKKHIYELNKNLLTQLNKIVNTYVISITYSSDENDINRKKLNKYIKENSIKETLYSEPFFKELAETSKWGELKEFGKYGVGLFASEDNLQNKELIEYLKEMMKRFDFIKVKLFYFFDHQKLLANHAFKKELNKIDIIMPHNLEDIASQVELWIETTQKTISLRKVNDILLNNYKNIYSSYFDKDKYLKSKKEISNEKIDIERKDELQLKNIIQDKYLLLNNDFYDFGNYINEFEDNESIFDNYKKEYIGFFAFSENLTKDFVKGVYEIAKAYPNLKFTAFYFEENQVEKTVRSFVHLANKINFMIPKNMKDISNNCEIWIQAGIKNQSFLHQQIKNILSTTKNIHSLIVDEDFEIEENKADYLEGLIGNYEEKLFTKKLNEELDIKRLQNSDPEDYIGFLATEDNLEDKDFLKLMDILLEKHPDIKFKGFYFTQTQKEMFESIFGEFLDRFELIIPNDIYEIIENISTYLHSYIKGKKSKSQMYFKVWRSLIEFKVNLFKIHLFKDIIEEDKYYESIELIDDSKMIIQKYVIFNIIKAHSKIPYFLIANNSNFTKSWNNFKKDTISFIANKDNLENKEFMNYLKKIHSKYSYINFTIFYFNELDKNRCKDFLQIDSRVNFLKTFDIGEIILNTHIYLSTNYQKDFIFKFLKKADNIFNMNFNKINFNFTIEDYDNMFDKTCYIFKDHNFFNITKDEVIKSDYKLISLVFNHFFKESKMEIQPIDKNIPYGELDFFKTIEWAHQNPTFINVRKKFYNLVMEYHAKNS